MSAETVETFKPGDGVVYRPHDNAPAEDGTVVRASSAGVFVRYHGSGTPKLTRAGDLAHVFPEPTA